MDLTFVWARELELTGSYVYGREPRCEGAPHTFDVAIARLSGRPELPVTDLITHRFPLSRWREAIGACLRRGQQQVVKAVFDLGSEH